MRALCGAIITAGSLIGLGLTALAFGTRYQFIAQGENHPVHLHEMDKSLVFVLVFLTATAIIGLGISFVGLAYHHYHRHHELLRQHGSPGQGTPTVSASAITR
jgi:hypothetical protein